ncbi:unnamed protein product [Heligmosomoides polygyrus]|uniref:SCP domain-containing protein n=1 Tax=Heligmosomoides polygyrus TaxID=6339 RepID=A0A183FIH1_HELPZ|nr:unnamed protein product [Heligmosomoides polygyrus]
MAADLGISYGTVQTIVKDRSFGSGREPDIDNERWRQMVESDPRRTTRELAQHLGVHYAAIAMHLNRLDCLPAFAKPSDIMKSEGVAAMLALRFLLVAADDVHLCAVDNPVSEARRSLIVYDHNVLRSRIAQAFSISPYGSQLPQASNIYRVAWNCELEHLAWNSVKSCSHQAVKHHLYAHNYEVIETNDMHEPDKLYTLAMEKWITSVKEANLTSDAIYFDGDEKLRPFANVRLLFIFFYITRSQLATGNVLRTKNHYMPEASNMVKLRYNCALEQYALTYASRCILKEQLQMEPRVQEEQLGGLSVIQIDSSEAADYAEAVQEGRRRAYGTLRFSVDAQRQRCKRQLHGMSSV